MDARLFACAALLSACPALLRADDADARVQEILDRWQTATEANCYFYAEGRRYVYDKTFEVETRGRFRTASDFTGRALLRLEPDEFEPGAVSKRIGKTGKAYSLRSDREEIFWLDESRIVHLNPDHRVGARYQVDEKDTATLVSRETWVSFWDSLNSLTQFCSFFAGRWTTEVVSRLRFEITKEENDTIWLKGVPITRLARDSYSEVELILDAETYLPKAIKITDPSENRETVYVYDVTKVNQSFCEEDSPFNIAWDEYRFQSYPLAE